jgi:hypothetical protein
MDLWIGAALGVVALCVVLRLKEQHDDRALDFALMSAVAEARALLSAHDMERLTQRLHELAAITHAHAAAGMSPKKASREGKRAAIQSVATAVNIERMFASKRHAA